MRLPVSFNEVDFHSDISFIQTGCTFNTDFCEVVFYSDISFIQTECTFNTDFGEVILVKNDEAYDGDYNVIPRVYQQTLETKDKVMLDDITVEIIPLAKTINLSNGYTVTIG